MARYKVTDDAPSPYKTAGLWLLAAVLAVGIFILLPLYGNYVLLNSAHAAAVQKN